MATAAGEATTVGVTAYEGGAGAGGKFRKKPFRRIQKTPYDRPPTSLRNPSSTRSGWVSKHVVDPASKLISASVNYFFTAFRKRLSHPPPPLGLPSEAYQNRSDKLQEEVPDFSKKCDRAEESTIAEHTTNSLGTSGISEFEQILKQKTFTRSEIDHLTQLLRSRTADLSAVDDNKRILEDTPRPVYNFDRHKKFAVTPVKENITDEYRYHGYGSTPVANSRVLEVQEDVASPAELAKAFMGNRPSKLTPSRMSLRSQALTEDANLVNNTPFLLKSPVMSLSPKADDHYGVSINGFTTPRSRGRSAIYGMARTPYSRVHQIAHPKATGFTNFGYIESPTTSSSRYASSSLGGQFGSKHMAQKRRISVFDDGIGSVGPVRRIRQKHNHLSQGTAILNRGVGVGSDVARREFSKTMTKNEDNHIPTGSYAHVPSRSIEVATKILQEIEKSSPEGKSSESKSISLREKLPTKLTPNMLHGKALRSLRNVDSSKLLQEAQDHCWKDAQGPTSQNLNKVEENGPGKFLIGQDSSTTRVNGDSPVSVKDNLPFIETGDAINTMSSAQPQQRRVFQMSALEDSVDDDAPSDGTASKLLDEGRRQDETAMAENKTNSTEGVGAHNVPALLESEKASSTIGSVAGEGTTAFMFPSSSAPSSSFQPAAPIQLSFGFDKITPIKEGNDAPLVSFCSTMTQPVNVSSSADFDESSWTKSNAWSDPKAEHSQSLGIATFGANGIHLKTSEADRSDEKSTQRTGDVIVKSDTPPPALSTSTSASSIFAFGATINKSDPHNQAIASGHSSVSSSSSVLGSSNHSNQSFINNSSEIPSSSITAVTTITVTTTSPSSIFATEVSASSASPSISATPIFKFGSSGTATSGVENTYLKAKNDKETSQTTFSSLTSSPFGGTPFENSSTGSGILGVSTGSDILGVSSSVGASSSENHSKGSPFSAGSGSLISTQVSAAGSEVATVSQCLFTQFGSSASTPIFGNSGSSSSSLFASSKPATNFGSGSTFGSGSSASSLETTTISSASSATTSSIFSFGANSSASSLQTNQVSSGTGTTTSTIFGFGQNNSDSSLKSNSSPSSIFGSTWQPNNAPMFPFGASSSTTASSNTAPLVFGSSSSAASSSSIFSFTTAASAASSLPPVSQMHPAFGNPGSVFTLPNSNSSSDQMNMEDSMAEDTVQASSTHVFGQLSIPASPGDFVFGSTAQSPSVPFQFGIQQNQSTPPNPFQASGSGDFGGGGSFSLGSMGNDKSNRKIVKINRNRNRRK